MRLSSVMASLALGVPLLCVSGCLRDFDQFDASGIAEDGAGGRGQGGDGASGGGTDSGGGSVDGGGGSASASGGSQSVAGGAPDGSGGTDSGDDGCSFGQKLCGDTCVPDDDPATGCAAVDCTPCPSLSHASVGCDAGQCAVLACEAGFVDCDGTDSPGCEHSPSSFSETACGGCDADCTSLGLSNCQGGECGCASAMDCEYNTDRGVACNDRLCECGGKPCQVGETCLSDRSSSICSCDGGAECPDGWVCCPGSAGGSCKDLKGADSSNCGACGWACADGEVCVDGVCQ